MHLHEVSIHRFARAGLDREALPIGPVRSVEDRDEGPRMRERGRAEGGRGSIEKMHTCLMKGADFNRGGTFILITATLPSR